MSEAASALRGVARALIFCNLFRVLSSARASLQYALVDSDAVVLGRKISQHSLRGIADEDSTKPFQTLPTGKGSTSKTGPQAWKQPLKGAAGKGRAPRPIVAKRSGSPRSKEQSRAGKPSMRGGRPARARQTFQRSPRPRKKAARSRARGRRTLDEDYLFGVAWAQHRQGGLSKGSPTEGRSLSSSAGSDDIEDDDLDVGDEDENARPRTSGRRAGRETAAEDPGPAEAKKFSILACTRKLYRVGKVAEQAGEWCDPKRVPLAKRAPKKLQGLFYMQGNALSDVLACLSLGIWDEEKRTLTIHVYETFVWLNTPAGLAGQQGSASVYYVFSFPQPDLMYATIQPTSFRPGGLAMSSSMSPSSAFPMMEKRAEHPGDYWIRPEKSGFRKAVVFEYRLLRIFDGDLKVLKVSNDNMIQRVRMVKQPLKFGLGLGLAIMVCK